MLSLRPVRRFCRTAAAIPSSDISATVVSDKRNPKPLEEPALIKLKAERDPEKLFHLFEANARNRLVVENRFAFEDTVSRLAGARRFDYIEHLLEQQKALPQGRREGFMVRIIMLYVPLALEGSVMIEQTVALVSVDVNGGHGMFGQEAVLGTTIPEVNLVATTEIRPSS